MEKDKKFYLKKKIHKKVEKEKISLNKTGSEFSDPLIKNIRSNSLNERKHKFVKVKSSSSKTELNQYMEDKILNVNIGYNTFIDVCEAFEKILNELNTFKGDDRVYKKLNEIKNLIEKKLQFFLKNELNEFQADCNISVSSVGSSDQYSENPLYKKFLSEVYCPFCTEVQNDQITLIRHLDESCLTHQNKQIKGLDHFPYAVFQILPNDTLKCNVCFCNVQSDSKKFFVHLNSHYHEKAYAAATSVKDYKNCLFCSCCKVIILMSYTQMSFHINNKIHKIRASKKRSPQELKAKGVYCVYDGNKKFKCLDCGSSKAAYYSLKDILVHLADQNHKKERKTGLPGSPEVFCEFCSQEVHSYQIINHFTSIKHITNEKKEEEKSFELCLYCGTVCDTLLHLSFHMESNCVEINKIKQKMSESSEVKVSGITEKNETEATNISEGSCTEDKGEIVAENKFGKNSVINEYCVTVKDYTDIPEIFKYFKNFGEILAMECYENKDVVIKFKDKTAVEDVLLLKNVIKIGGLKVELTAGNPDGSNKDLDEVKIENKSSNISDVSDSSDEESEDKEVGGCDGLMFQDYMLEELFQTVSSHLLSSTQKLDSAKEQSIIVDCCRTLEIKTCDFAGFSACGLTFPFESVKIFCDLEENFNANISCDNLKSSYDTKFFAQITMKAFRKFQMSELWANVEYCLDDDPRLCIKALHKESQKGCTVTFMRSALLLTQMLRDCIEKNNLIRPFCLIVKFWLSVHELQIRKHESALISLLIFFLINEKVVLLPSKYSIQPFITSEKCENFRNSSEKPASSVKELFQKFLHFINTFDFEKNVIYLPFPEPVPKSIFTEKAFKLKSGITNPAHLISTSMCIMDPILFVNLASDIKKKEKEKFLKIVDVTIKQRNIA